MSVYESVHKMRYHLLADVITSSIDRVYSLDQFLLGNVFQKITGDAGLHCIKQVLLVGMHCQHDDLYFREIRMDLACGDHTALPRRHADIKHDNIGLKLCDCIVGLLAVCRGSDHFYIRLMIQQHF